MKVREVPTVWDERKAVSLGHCVCVCVCRGFGCEGEGVTGAVVSFDL